MKCRIALLLFPIMIGTTAAADDVGIEVAEGLQITLAADDEVVPDCTNITIDSSGHVVASGPGYIRLLKDEDGDGRFEGYVTLTGSPARGAHGLCFDDGNLYFVGDNGVWRLTDSNSDGIVDSLPLKMMSIKTGGEHDAHALRKGPDGNWYLIAGNGTKGMFDLQNVDDPVIANPRAGVIWQISADWSRRQVWAHGFRNAFDFDFAPDHSIDTFDSDGERDVSLPWYRPTRVFRVRKGNDAGWMTRSWKRPNVDPQMPIVRAELGRGSPTGVLRYQQNRLPKRFHDGVFVADWTFGRIIFVHDDGRVTVIAKPEGTTGFAVTDIAADPDGRLFVSVGGRGSRGGLYVIDATAPTLSPSKRPALWRQSIADRPGDAATEIKRLRSQAIRRIDPPTASRAIAMLEGFETPPIEAMTLLIECVGGLGQGNPKDARGKEQVAAVFDGYRSQLRPKLSPGDSERAADALLRILKSDSSSEDAKRESVRTLAVMEPDSADAFTCVADDMDRVKTPVEKLHRLIALARLPVSRSDEMTDRIAAAMLEIPVLVDQQGLRVDRNWTPRMGELFLALQRRDSLLPSRLVSLPRFGHRSHLIWTDKMDPENLERARRLFLTQSVDGDVDPDIARFIALGDDAVPRSHARRWLADPTTRSAGWLAIASHPREADADILLEAAGSVDKTVREAASRALQRLGIERPEPTTDSPTIRQWLARAQTIQRAEAKAERGKSLFLSQQCAACHNGGKALGPSLEGIAKRYGFADLLRATVDPNHNIADRYRAKRVLTRSDEILVGMTIYESVDGLTLLTVEGKTLRINADEIVEARPATKSLMPEGLIDQLSDQQVADLIEYMRSL